jgi:hypothetical protein
MRVGMGEMSQRSTKGPSLACQVSFQVNLNSFLKLVNSRLVVSGMCGFAIN